MSTMQESIEREVERIRVARGMQPPAPLEAGSPPPRMQPLARDEELGLRHDIADRAVESLGLVAKGALRTLTLATEPLRRADTAFRGTILTATGRIPLGEYPAFLNRALRGHQNISGDEFNRLAFGQKMHKALDQIPLPLIGGTAAAKWMKKFLFPEGYMASQRGEELEDFTLGDALGFGAEVFVSPFAARAMMPTSTLAGKFAADAMDAPFNALIWPMRKAAAMASNAGIPGIDYLLLALRPPQGALSRFPGMLGDLLRDTDAFTTNLSNTSKALQEIGKTHKAVFRDKAAMQRVTKHLFDQKQKLSPEELALADDIWDKVGLPLYHRTKEMGYHYVPGSAQKIAWDPDERFRQFVPRLKGYMVQKRAVGEALFAERMRVSVPWKKPGMSLANIFPGLTDEHFDLPRAVGSIIMSMERKLVFEARERTSKMVTRTNKGLGPLFGPPVKEEVSVARWKNTGVVSKYRPYRPGSGSSFQNPEIKKLGMKPMEENYWYKYVHQLTGHGTPKWQIHLDQLWEGFVANLDAGLKSGTRSARVVNYLMRGKSVSDALPPSIDAMTGMLIANTAVATLGLNLASSLHNLSQLANPAALEGVPAVMRGLVRFAAMGEKGDVLREARKIAQFKAPFLKLTHDPSWSAVRGSHPLTDLLMGPFNFTENFVRGTAYHVGIEKALKKRGLKVEDFVQAQKAAQKQGADWIHLGPVLREAKEFAQDTNFVYGIAGRSSFMTHPVARIGMTLQSYSLYQTEWLGRTMQKDGGAFMRWLAINGWAIDMWDKVAGVNAESWMGWGFLPPSTIGRGPQAEMAGNLAQMLFAAGTGNSEEFERASARTQGNVRELFRTFGVKDEEIVTGSSTALTAVATLGLLPVPIVGISRTAKALNEFLTGIREEEGGASWSYVTRQEAMTSWFATTHQAHAEQKLRAMDISIRKQVDRELDRRTRKFVNALRGRSGDEVNAAARELATPIALKLPLGAARGLMKIPSFILGDEDSFWPHPTMIENRVSTLVKRSIMPRALYEMDSSGWTKDILWAHYSQRALDALGRGGVRNLNER